MDYERELFAQKTPYLQWLKDRKNVEIDFARTKGKQVYMFPFCSCRDVIKDIPGMNMADIDSEKIYLFYNEAGKLQDRAYEVIEQTFLKYKNVRLVYADEDYFGTLEELYNIKEECTDKRITDEYESNEAGLFRGEPWFKPDFSPDTLESFFYIGNIFAVKGQVILELADKYGMSFTLYELVKYISHEITKANDAEHGRNVFVHIPDVLYTNNSLSGKNELEGYMKKSQISIIGGLKSPVSVSVIIPSKDNPDVLQRCIKTFVDNVQMVDYEFIIVDNGSTKENRRCIKAIVEEYGAQYIYRKMEFNFSKMCNIGAKASKGEFLLFLNDDIEIRSSGWLKKMTEYARLEHVGAVGIKLHYPDGRLIQHAGITNMAIGPAHKLGGLPDEGCLYHGHNICDYNMLAVTAACMMLSREKFERAGGFDEELAIAYNDVELCFRLYRSGLYNVQINSESLLHHESLSRGYDNTKEKQERLLIEKQKLYEKHRWALPGMELQDCFYSPNLVQWEKDINYNVGYQYPFDRPVKLKELSLKERRVLLCREKRQLFIKRTGGIFERLYNRLTGQSRHMLTIDSIEEENGIITITGWYVMRGYDNAELKKSLLIYNDNSAAEAELSGKLREDAEELFKSDSDRTKHTALSGIRLRLNASELGDCYGKLALKVEFNGKSQLVFSQYMVDVS